MSMFESHINKISIEILKDNIININNVESALNFFNLNAPGFMMDEGSQNVANEKLKTKLTLSIEKIIKKEPLDQSEQEFLVAYYNVK